MSTLLRLTQVNRTSVFFKFFVFINAFFGTSFNNILVLNYNYIFKETLYYRTKPLYKILFWALDKKIISFLCEQKILIQTFNHTEVPSNVHFDTK